MHSLSGLEISKLVSEFTSLEGAYIEKFYELQKNSFRLRMKKNTQINIECDIPDRIYITSYITQSESATNFAIAVRKHISGLRVNKIYQLNNDRIVVFNLKGKETEKNLIFELFGRGNVIITDTSMKILLCYDVHDFKDRQIRPGKEYISPANSFVSSIEEFARIFPKCKKEFIENAETSRSQKLIVFLIKYLNFGPIYIEDALLRAGINPKQDIQQAIDDTKILSALSQEFNNLNPIYTIYFNEGQIEDYSILKLKKYKGFEEKEFLVFNELMDYIAQNYVQPAQPGAKQKLNPEIEETENSIKKQQKLFEQNKIELQAAKDAGETIFRNMQLINAVLAAARENKNITLDRLQEMFPEIKIFSVDLKKKTIEIELQ